ncbi:MAG TPA: type I methionyl aminopeptidase [Spirochaetota bacterium]|nr:type I methionyl aminopeptidase [Spirochaetota bacterium]HPC42800.1 type I methionyl aminopeptidase [Spirochaetota bacterium]HPL15964.1 type I methionyl aminopeptidase [Spirochaetota bacterium]HQF08997.1 type I methionyl aminopeptidase [Spirochaetota bacterium]HQH97885.1 type I methionyl aminopeptidase [Spirochaetota bacterium]
MRNNRVRIKSPDDIKRIRDAGIIIADIFKKISRISLAGLSTWEIDTMIDSMIIKKKGRAAFKTVPGYSAASCISINDEVVHGIPSKKRKIRTGDLVKIDIGVVLNGYFGDACKTFSAGRITDNARRLSETTSRSLEKAIEVMMPGNRIGDIGNAIQEYAESCGFSVVRNYTGHGVGFALHEPPVVPHYGKKKTGIVLEPGMVLAVEPMINEGGYGVRLLDDGWTAVTADGSLSAHFEHTIAVTGSGPVILTA